MSSKKFATGGVVLDRSRSQYVIMASTEGGVEIEKVAAETPEKILKEWITPGIGLQAFAERVNADLETAGFPESKGGQVARRLLGNSADAEDAVQEIFIEIWANAARFDPAKGSEVTFVATIARRRPKNGSVSTSVMRSLSSISSARTTSR